jgi:hypothetical protein
MLLFLVDDYDLGVNDIDFLAFFGCSTVLIHYERYSSSPAYSIQGARCSLSRYIDFAFG